MLNEYIDVLQAAQVLHRHPETIKRLIRHNKIEALKFGNKWLLKKSHVQALASALKISK